MGDNLVFKGTRKFRNDRSSDAQQDETIYSTAASLYRLMLALYSLELYDYSKLQVGKHVSRGAYAAAVNYAACQVIDELEEPYE